MNATTALDILHEGGVPEDVASRDLGRVKLQRHGQDGGKRRHGARRRIGADDRAAEAVRFENEGHVRAGPQRMTLRVFGSKKDTAVTIWLRMSSR